MSTVDALIGVAIGLGGSVPLAVVVHLLDQRRESRRLRQETMLSSIKQRQSALKEAYDSLVNLVYVCGLHWHATNDAEKIADASDRFDISLMKAMIWMSSDNLRKVWRAQDLLWKLTLKMIRGEATFELDASDLSHGFALAATAVAGDLHADILDTQLQEFASHFTSRPSRQERADE